jgi:poly(hydroxyalkanoate) depolymerase family esterase
MRGLGETVALLGRAARDMSANDAPVGSARLVETTAFGANPGGLRMLSYAPDGLPKGAPLVVTLHGCSQSGPGYAVRAGWIELAGRLGFAVLAPEQATANNLNRCFNWFSGDDVVRGQGEVASIAAMVAAAVRAHDLDPRKVFVTGLSAGGAMAAAMLATYPELFAGGAILAGLPYGVARDMHGALKVMRQADGRDALALGELVRRAAPKTGPGAGRSRLKLSIWQGDADTVVVPANADDIAAQWTAVAGLSQAPDQVIELPGRTRKLWSSGARNGPVVELNLVAGLGHGTPLATGGEDGLGSAAPFMLEHGLSSTREIAGFWGLGPMPGYVRQPAEVAEPVDPVVHELPAVSGLAAQVIEAIDRHVPADIHDVIVKSLRTAGLMR